MQKLPNNLTTEHKNEQTTITKERHYKEILALKEV